MRAMLHTKAEEEQDSDGAQTVPLGIAIEINYVVVVEWDRRNEPLLSAN